MGEGFAGPATRPSLLLRLRDARDSDAWNTFTAVYGPLIHNYSRRKGLSVADSEEVAQKVFLRLVQSLGTFEYQPKRGRFRDWLGTIVRHEIIRQWHQQQRQVEGADTVRDERVLEGIEARVEDTAWNEAFHAQVLREALARSRLHFAEPTWRAFEGVWLHNRPALEVARELGQQPPWVYLAKTRVLKRLWEQVQELADDSALLVLQSQKMNPEGTE
jgi:RNA polymerase sigma-70 factor (ECF subfamily)